MSNESGKHGLLTDGEYAALQNARPGDMYKYNSGKGIGYFLLLNVECTNLNFEDLRSYHIRWLYTECAKTKGDMCMGTYLFISIFNRSELIR